MSVALLVQRPSDIAQRLAELDREWDIERAIEVNAALIAMSGLALAAVQDRRWMILSGLVTCFLLQHAVQGWCPPVPVLRAMGFCTADEIHEERTALKAVRGDFGSSRSSPARALQAARA